ncbi:hypothetical protein KBC31_03885 [Candidatus Saccharibacteria bacterium]|nr:hypothetical protein [Candidatus Saccharibacteria bacterium]
MNTGFPKKITTETPTFNKELQIPSGKPDGVLVMIAPAGWHWRWYIPFIQDESLKNWVFVLYAGRNLRYYVLSGKIREGIHVAEDIRDDAVDTIRGYQERGIRTAIFGVSFGATTALEIAKKSQADRSVLVAPHGDLLKSLRDFNYSVLARDLSPERLDKDIKWVEERMDSMRHIDRLPDKSVLLYTSANDTILPYGAELELALKAENKLTNHFRYRRHRHLATALRTLLQSKQWLAHIMGGTAEEPIDE